MRGHAGRPVAQEDDHASAFLLEALQGGVDRGPAAKHVADEISSMQPRQHVPAVADAAVDKSHMLDGIERGDERIPRQCTDFALRWKFAYALDEFVARLP